MKELKNKIDKIQNNIFSDYKKKTKKSNTLFNKLSKKMPGGVSGSFRYFAPYPFYIKSALKSHITDIDNNNKPHLSYYYNKLFASIATSILT